jgi:hypothetical protein
MPTQNTTDTGGYITNSRDSAIFSWSNTRNGIIGTAVAVNPTLSRVGEYTLTGRGGGTHNILRTYLAFDLSSVVGTIQTIDLVLTAGVSQDSSSDVIVVKATAPGITTNLTTSNFGNINFNTLYSFGWNWTASATNTIPLTLEAVIDAINNGELILSIIDSEYDYLDVPPDVSNIRYNQIEYSTGTTPYLSYTALTDYGNTVSGVISANIGEVNGVAISNIETVIGV